MIVLAMITKNSYRELGMKFVETLRRSLQVPYNAIILVDDGDDETPEVVKKFAEEHNKEILVTRSRLYGYHRPTRATARQTAIDVFMENFDSKWLMFLDDDAWLNPGWWDDVKRFTEEQKVGEIWGINWDREELRKRFLEMLGINYEEYLIRAFEKRGGTHDTLYRREALEGIEIPPCLHVYEDAFIHFYVTCRDWEYRISKVGITHVNPGRRLNREFLLVASKFALLTGIETGYTGKLTHDFLVTLRPIAGFLPSLIVGIRTYGVRKGFKIAFNFQYNKLINRYYLHKAARELRKELGRIDPAEKCSLVLEKVKELKRILCT